MPRDLATLPKGHLHLHLEGGMRHSTLLELCDTYGIVVPEIRSFGSFSAFADLYMAACAVLRTPEDLVRLVDEATEDAALAGAVWFEPSFYPPHHRDTFGSDEGALEVVLDSLTRAADRHGIEAGLMLASDRTQPPQEAVALARLGVRHADNGVVSFGLANDETLGAPELYEEAFTIIRRAGILSTPHAGELCGPDSIRATLDSLGPDRLQHGVRAAEDADLLSRLADEQICCDVCPTSNILLSVFDEVAEHPLPAMLAAGVPCSINADDPLLFGPGLLEEYELCRNEIGLGDAQLASIALASLDHSGAPEGLVVTTAERINAWLSQPEPSG